MKDVRIATVGGNRLIAEELRRGVRQCLAQDMAVAAMEQKEVTAADMADLFVCLPTRVAELARVVPAGKIIGLDIFPTADFFVRVARIPRGVKAYVFHNIARGAQPLLDSCRATGIDDVEFAVLPFEELAEDELAAQLGEARYILGIDALVGPEGLLPQRYGACVRPEARIIPAVRVPTLASAIKLRGWLVSFAHRSLSLEVAEATRSLKDELGGVLRRNREVSASLQQNAATINEVAARMERQCDEFGGLSESAAALAEAVQSIHSIAATIRRIAAQTKLLALNAAIEAARAGEHGRGFAVVAREVGSLAQESSASIDGIGQALSGVRAVVADIVPTINAIADEVRVNQGRFSALARDNLAGNELLTEAFRELEAVEASSDALVAAVDNLLRDV